MVESAPTNISATAVFKTKYMLRLRRLRFFIKTTIVTRFITRAATDSVTHTVSQVMHSAEENDMIEVLLLLLSVSLIK